MSSDTLYCSFYGKSQHEVRSLIAGFICNECTDLCHEICHPIPKAVPSPAADQPRLCIDCRWAKLDYKSYGSERQWTCLA